MAGSGFSCTVTRHRRRAASAKVCHATDRDARLALRAPRRGGDAERRRRLRAQADLAVSAYRGVLATEPAVEGAVADRRRWRGVGGVRRHPRISGDALACACGAAAQGVARLSCARCGAHRDGEGGAGALRARAARPRRAQRKLARAGDGPAWRRPRGAGASGAAGLVRDFARSCRHRRRLRMGVHSGLACRRGRGAGLSPARRILGARRGAAGVARRASHRRRHSGGFAMIAAKMRAVIAPNPGGPEVLTLVERPTPTPGAGEILIKVAAAGVNRPDILQRLGNYQPPPGASDVLGLEVAGEVAALGEGVAMHNVGDMVTALLPGGGYAEYAIAHESNALPIPLGMREVEAAAIPETFFTVWTNV